MYRFLWFEKQGRADSSKVFQPSKWINFNHEVRSAAILLESRWYGRKGNNSRKARLA